MTGVRRLHLACSLLVCDGNAAIIGLHCRLAIGEDSLNREVRQDMDRALPRPDGRAAVHWTPRLAPTKVRRLYESEAAGHLDEALLDEVGITLLLRCEDILTVAEARAGRVACPRCADDDQRTIILRRGRARDEIIVCPACDWRITWADYLRTFQRRQLHIGGAGPAFRRFVDAYPKAHDNCQKMLLVDQLIHEFHYALQDEQRPVRAACVNLIKGKLGDVVRFLDDLSAGTNLSAAFRDSQQRWRESVEELERNR